MKSQHIRSGSLRSLRFLDKIHVEVDSLSSEVKAAGLSAKTLEQNIRADLKEVPILTLSRTGILHVPGAPTLHIRVSSSESENGLCPYSIIVELRESVNSRDPRMDLPLTASTWRVEAFGAVATDELSSLKEEVSALIGEFINDLGRARQEQNED